MLHFLIGKIITVLLLLDQRWGGFIWTLGPFRNHVYVLHFLSTQALGFFLILQRKEILWLIQQNKVIEWPFTLQLKIDLEVMYIIGLP